jgi:hypothetical protein
LFIHTDEICVGAIDIGYSYQHLAIRDPDNTHHVKHFINPTYLPFETLHQQALSFVSPSDVIYNPDNPGSVPRIYHRNLEPLNETIHAFHGPVQQGQRICRRWDAVVVRYQELASDPYRTPAPAEIKTFLKDYATCLQIYTDIFSSTDNCNTNKSPELFQKFFEAIKP